MIPDDQSIKKSKQGVIACPTYNGPTYDSPTYDDDGQTKCFSLQSLLGLPRLSNKCVTHLFRTALTKKLKKLGLSLVASIINPAKREWLRCTRLFSLRCALSLRDSLYRWCTTTLQGCYLSPDEHQAYETYYPTSVHEITLPAMRIEPTKAVTSFLVNIKSTRSCGTSKNATVYLAAW